MGKKRLPARGFKQVYERVRRTLAEARSRAWQHGPSAVDFFNSCPGRRRKTVRFRSQQLTG